MTDTGKQVGDSRQAGAKGKKKGGEGRKTGQRHANQSTQVWTGRQCAREMGWCLRRQTAARTSDKSAGTTSDNSTVVYTGWREENMWEE